MTALPSPGRPPVANAFSQREAMPWTSWSLIQGSHLEAEVRLADRHSRSSDKKEKVCILEEPQEKGD